jgi:hypothetical protein
MTESQSQPNKLDAILGGQNPPPVTGAILGGLEGAKQRLESETVAARLVALSEAFQYGEEGIELGITALNDPSGQVQKLACRLLRHNEQGARALLEHQPLNYFATFANWQQEIYNPQVGITDPINNAYVVRMTNIGQKNSYNLSQFEALLQDPRLSELQALVFQIDCNYNYWYDEDRSFGAAVDAIYNAQKQFPNLKALFVGDSEGDNFYEYRKSKVMVSDIHLCLEAFPTLEVFQTFGHFAENNLKCEGLRHETLKTLIIATADISDFNIKQLCGMDLPALECFELWFGRSYHHEENSLISALQPIFECKKYPKLKYLGLCSCESANSLLTAILDSKIQKQLVVLDLQRGTLDNIDSLLNHKGFPNLKLLNVSDNNLDDGSVEKLNSLPFDIVADNQYQEEEYREDEEEENDDDYEEEDDEEYGRSSRHDALYE